MNHIKLFILSIGCLSLLSSAIALATDPEVNQSSDPRKAKTEKRDYNLFEDCINHHIFLYGESNLKQTMIQAYRANNSYEEIKKKLTDEKKITATDIFARALVHCFEKASDWSTRGNKP